MKNRLAELRKSYGMTQKELANKVGLTPKAISFYELGQREISNDLLKQFSEIFGVTTDYILNINSEKHEEIQNEGVKILAREANDLSEDEIEILRSVIKKFKANKK